MPQKRAARPLAARSSSPAVTRNWKPSNARTAAQPDRAGSPSTRVPHPDSTATVPPCPPANVSRTRTSAVSHSDPGHVHQPRYGALNRSALPDDNEDPSQPCGHVLNSSQRFLVSVVFSSSSAPALSLPPGGEGKVMPAKLSFEPCPGSPSPGPLRDPGLWSLLKWSLGANHFMGGTKR